MREHDIVLATKDIKVYKPNMSHGNKPLFDIIKKDTTGTIVHVYPIVPELPPSVEVEFCGYIGPVTVNLTEIKPV